MASRRRTTSGRDAAGIGFHAANVTTRYTQRYRTTKACRRKLQQMTQWIYFFKLHFSVLVTVHGPMVWNSLPDDLRAQQDYESFRQGLKTWLFSKPRQLPTAVWQNCFRAFLFEKYVYISALEMASPQHQHCANCFGALSFPIYRPAIRSTGAWL